MGILRGGDSMDIQLVKQYRYLLHEVDIVDEQIQKIISGVHIGNEEIIAILEQRKSNCLTQIKAIEDWIVAIPDKKVQQYVFLRYVDGLTYRQIAVRTYGSEEAVKMAIKRCVNAELKKYQEQ